MKTEYYTVSFILENTRNGKYAAELHNSDANKTCREANRTVQQQECTPVSVTTLHLRPVSSNTVTAPELSEKPGAAPSGGGQGCQWQPENPW